MYWPFGTPRVYASPQKPKSQIDEENPGEELEISQEDRSIAGLQIARNGTVFATITATTLSIWHVSPVALITAAERSQASIRNYGHNVGVLLRSDCSIAAVQTSLGFLVTYNITFDQDARVYRQNRMDDKAKRPNSIAKLPVEEAAYGQREIHVRFRMVIKVDAGIGHAIALEEELIVATQKPAAVQCIRWTPDSTKNQTSTELLSRLPWINRKSLVTELVFDRAMSLFVWILDDGKAYAVQKIHKDIAKVEGHGKFFKGYEFHSPGVEEDYAVKASVNARFSLLAIGCANGNIHIYTARDYAGSIPLSHKLEPPASSLTTGKIQFLTYSPDGYCLFVGYERGWATWSVYGRLGGHSFVATAEVSKDNDDRWISGTREGAWVNGGSEMILTTPDDDRVWVLEFAKSAVTGCFGPANISRTLLHTATTLMLYNGHDAPDITSLSAADSIWTHVQIPMLFLINQRPIRSAVISPDGRYVAVAGRRGLAHYSVHSGRWKTFDDLQSENAFIVRGGMCWHQHILIAAVDAGSHDELRLYSRETGLSETSMLHREKLSSRAIIISPSGEDSLLVYTEENYLYQYIINITSSGLSLVCVGQIGLHGIVRSPARVRAVTWYIPEHQLLDGDPSQDVIHASVLFLVDAKLVLLQPTTDDNGSIKYDMRIIANEVEFFNFTRDQVALRNQTRSIPSISEIDEPKPVARDLLDSLWYFNGHKALCWPDVQDLFKAASTEGNKELPEAIQIPVDFYPLSISLNKAIIVGLEPELVQRRDIYFAYFRFSVRNHLFLPPILHHYLANSDATSALSLCHHYQNLSYFAHALEVLLHTILDEEVDTQPAVEEALLPSVLSFLSSFPEYLDILVQCTRKTEVRSWRTLFKTLPPPQDLFEESLQKGWLKTAGGYLIVLHTFEKLEPGSEQCIRLLHKAKNAGDWELCKELARFLMALDGTGDTLRDAMKALELEPPPTPHVNGQSFPRQGSTSSTNA